MSQIRTYHLAIKAARLFLLLALGGVLGGLVIIPMLFQNSGKNSHAFKDYRIKALSNHLHKAVYHATHQDNPYQVIAEKAHNVTNDSVALSTLHSTIRRQDRDLSLRSRSGLYDKEKETLELHEDVTLTTSDGYTFDTPDATVHLGANRIQGSNGITGEGPLGSLQATKFEIHNQGERIVLKGPSSLVIR